MPKEKELINGAITVLAIFFRLQIALIIGFAVYVICTFDGYLSMIARFGVIACAISYVLYNPTRRFFDK